MIYYRCNCGTATRTPPTHPKRRLTEATASHGDAEQWRNNGASAAFDAAPRSGATGGPCDAHEPCGCTRRFMCAAWAACAPACRAGRPRRIVPPSRASDLCFFVALCDPVSSVTSVGLDLAFFRTAWSSVLSQRGRSTSHRLRLLPASLHSDAVTVGFQVGERPPGEGLPPS